MIVKVSMKCLLSIIKFLRMFRLILFILPICLGHPTDSEYKEPKDAFSELWLNNTVPGEVDQLGDLTVFRFVCQNPKTLFEICVFLDMVHQLMTSGSSGVMIYMGLTLDVPRSIARKRTQTWELLAFCLIFSEGIILGQILRQSGMVNWVGRTKQRIIIKMKLPTLGLDWEELLVPYLEIGGAQSVGVVGTCFGSYIAIHTSASGASFMKGGVSIHPAHPGGEYMMIRCGK